MTIMQTARHLMAVLAPLTGERAEGTITITTRADVPELEIPLNFHLLPVLQSAEGNGALAPQLPFRVAEAGVATPDGVTFPVTSVLGGTVHNLPDSTVFRCALEDNRIASIEASSLIEGATNYTGTGALKQILMYETIGNSSAQRDLFLAKLAGRTPAAVIVWESSGSPTFYAPNHTKLAEQWAIHVVVSRFDAGELRALEGLEILDMVSELLGLRVGVDGADITNGAIKILGRQRTATTDSAYIYTLRIGTSTVVTRRDDRSFPEYLRTKYTLVTTPADTALSPSVVTLVEDAEYDHPVDDDEDPEEP